MKCKICEVDAFSKEFCSYKCESEFFTRNTKSQTALDVQEGGSHYKVCKIQPIEYMYANNLNYAEGAIVKYITRHRLKGKAEDIRKIKHFCDLILQLEYNE